MFALRKKSSVMHVALAAMMVCATVLPAAASHAAEQATPIAFADEDFAPGAITLKDDTLKILPNDWAPVVKDFPAYGSQEAKDEIVILKYLKNFRTQDNVDRIVRQHKMESPTLPFIESGLLDAETKPATMELIAAVMHDVDVVVMRQKFAFKRLRPIQVDKDLDVLFHYPPHASYPSGHATEARVTALLLSDVDPAHAHEYMDVAQMTARGREIAGVHYPSDTEAGFSIANQIVDAMKGTEKFKALDDKARQEYKI